MVKFLRNAALVAFAMTSWNSVSAEITGSGTEADPYLISSKEDLGEAYTKMEDGKITYFKQTADIDMAGVTDYITFCGHSGDYNQCINYDGDNHIISNFAPTDRIAGTGDKAYYDTSIFGVMTGTIKNLGVVDANIVCDWFEAGILGGFAGVGGEVNSAIVSESVIENVFVTGKIKPIKGGSFANGVAGGMFGTTAVPVKFTNCYSQVEIESEGAYVSGIMAKTANDNSFSHCYASATLTGATATLIVGVNTEAETAPKITFDNVVAFGTGDACNVATTGTANVYAAGDEEGIEQVQGWEAFSSDKLYNELPGLAWQFEEESDGISDITVDAAAEAEYYNLNGVKVAQPANGLYIVKQGAKVSKVVK